MKRWIVTVLVIFSILAILAVLLYGGAIFYFRHRAFEGLTPAQIKGYDDWRTKKWTFPPEDIQAPPFTDATIEADRKFREEWDKVEKEVNELIEKYYDYKTLDSLQSVPSGWEALAAELPKFEPLLTAFENVVRQPDYEMDFFVAGIDPAEHCSFPSPAFTPVSLSVTLLRLKSYLLLSGGKEAEAMKTAALIVESARTPKFTPLITRSFGSGLLATGAQAWYDLVEHCENAEILRWSFSRQRDLGGRVEIAPRNIPTDIVDKLGSVRIVSRYGSQTDVKELTACQIMGLWFWAESEYRKRVVLPAVAGDLARSSRAKRESEDMHLGYVVLGGKASSAKEYFVPLLSPIAVPMHYQFTIDDLDFHTRALATRAQFDLLRIFTAAKLQRLENGRPPATWDDLVPDYFPAPLADLFDEAGKPYGLLAPDGSSGPDARPYSIGPDKTDQKGAIPYDPSNGTSSGGDILFQEIKKQE